MSCLDAGTNLTTRFGIMCVHKLEVTTEENLIGKEMDFKVKTIINRKHWLVINEWYYQGSTAIIVDVLFI